jgi:hypothetical protein
MDTLKIVIYLSSLFYQPEHTAVVAVSDSYIGFYDRVTYRWEKIIEDRTTIYIFKGGYISIGYSEVEVKLFGKSKPMLYKIRKTLIANK